MKLSQLFVAAAALSCLTLVAVAQSGAGPGRGPSRALGIGSDHGLLGEIHEAVLDVNDLMESERAAAEEAAELAIKLRQEKNGDVSEAIREATEKALREAITRQFEMQQERRSLEVSHIEQRLQKLKETMSRRDEAKDAIIARRFDELRGVLDDLGWEETPIPSDLGSMGGGYPGYPGMGGGAMGAPGGYGGMGGSSSPFNNVKTQPVGGTGLQQR